MAEYGSPVHADWVPVTVRLKVPAGISGAEVFRLAERWVRELHIKIKFDPDYSPVPVLAPRAERDDFRESDSQLVVVRAWVDPQDIARLKDHPNVHHVARDARLEPFGGPEPTMVQQAAALHRALARVDCGATARADGTAADVARDLGVTRIRRAGLHRTWNRRRRR